MWILYWCLRKGKEALRGEVKEGNRLDLPFYAILQTRSVLTKTQTKTNTERKTKTKTQRKHKHKEKDKDKDPDKHKHKQK